MFRLTPNGCTRRYKERFGRAGPCLKRGRGDPRSHLRIVDTAQRFLEFEDIEKILSNYNQKEKTS